MFKYFNSLIVSLFMLTAAANVAVAKDSQLQIRTEQQSLTELKAEGLISEQGYADLLALGVEADTQVTVNISRNLDALRKQLQSGDDLNAQSSSGLPEDGDEREHRWEREENGDIYRYIRIERFFESNGSSGWREVHYERSYVGPAPGDGDIPTDPE